MTQIEEKQNIELAIIKEKVFKIENWIDNADSNHFPTIEKRFDRIEQKIAYWVGGIGALTGLLQLILKYF